MGVVISTCARAGRADAAARTNESAIATKRRSFIEFPPQKRDALCCYYRRGCCGKRPTYCDRAEFMQYLDELLGRFPDPVRAQCQARLTVGARPRWRSEITPTPMCAG